MSSDKKSITRRQFMKGVSIGALGAGFVMGDLAKNLVFSEESKETAKDINFEYRTLGKTGLKVTTIGYGAMRTTEEAVIKKAYELGINYFDTADCYFGGENEKTMGRALKGYRDKVILATKVHNAKKEDMIKSIEKSLTSLNVDVIDIMQLHGVSSAGEVKDSVAIEVLEKCKKDGKIRFAGVTTHQNVPIVVDAAIESKFYDVILLVYHYKSEKDVGEAIDRAGKAGIGIIAMKTQAGGYKTEEMKGLSPHQAALKWVLTNKNVHTTVPSMVNFDQLNENIAVMGKKLTANDISILNRYTASISSVYCTMCSSCNGSCPNGVKVQDINRFLMYYEGYGDYYLGKSNYKSLTTNEVAQVCIDCDSCIVKCATGLNIKEKMVRAHSLFA